MDSFWERLSDSAKSAVIYKTITIIAIFIIAQVAVKVFNNLLKKWQGIIGRRNRGAAYFRSQETRFAIIRRILDVGIYFVALTFILFQFDAVRSIGVGLFASAGLASVVIGLAAQNTLSNIIAGISISFSQPVRLGDAVIFKGEFGTIEEISLMHSIIATWDNRRIIVPNSVMASEVIENWTIRDPVLLGSVNLYVDYTCDVDKLREWAVQIINTSPNSTPEHFCVVQVIDLKQQVMEVRILVRGEDPGTTWNLRCEVREKMIKKIKDAGLPLPQVRLQMQGEIKP